MTFLEGNHPVWESARYTGQDKHRNGKMCTAVFLQLVTWLV